MRKLERRTRKIIRGMTWILLVPGFIFLAIGLITMSTMTKREMIHANETYGNTTIPGRTYEKITISNVTAYTGGMGFVLIALSSIPAVLYAFTYNHGPPITLREIFHVGEE